MTAMVTRRRGVCSALSILAGLAGSMAAAACHAQEASPWIADAHSSLRLLAGARGDGVLLGGIEIVLKRGWKTYWRTPGDSGVPPRFDFSRSDNVETVTVLWPAPTRFDDGAGGFAIGYSDNVVLPLRIVPKDTAKPVTLRAAVDYAICEKLCVPVHAAAELALTANPGIQPERLAAALQSVPRPGRIGDGEFTVRSISREGARKVVIDVTVPPRDGAELFVEGPTEHWALPIPKLEQIAAGGTWRFAFDLDGLPPGEAAAGAQLRLTLVGTGQAFEYRYTLK